MTEPHIRVAADIGDVFTTVAAIDERTGQATLAKSPTTHWRLLGGLREALAKSRIPLGEVSSFTLATRIARQTLIERSGARTALITTAGFRDVYEIGRVESPDMLDLQFKRHAPLVRRSWCFEANERMSADGEVLVPLDEESVEAICGRIADLRIVEAVAIVFLHGDRYPEHERRTRSIVERRLPHAYVTASHELSPFPGELERTSTTVANAFAGGRGCEHVESIDKHLRENGFRGSFQLVQSNGDLSSLQDCTRSGLSLLDGGSPAGVMGAQAQLRSRGLRDALVLDLGGTTARACVVTDSQPMTTMLTHIGSGQRALPIQMPRLDMLDLEIGYASIAEVDAGGGLRVGAKTAGAEPGPASFCQGGDRPTVLDACLALGRLTRETLADSGISLDPERARRAIGEHVAAPLGVSIEAAAENIVRIAASALSSALEKACTERGIHAGALPLIAYGDAGPLLADEVVRELGCAQLIFPPAPEHFRAFGMLHRDPIDGIWTHKEAPPPRPPDLPTGLANARLGPLSGGWSATLSEDGANAGVCCDGGDVGNASIEWLEIAHPLLVEEITFRRSSGSAGKYRGGLGLELTVRARSSMKLVIDASGGPAGDGDRPSNEVMLMRDGRVVPLPAVTERIALALEPGDTLTLRSGGGGGSGNPAEREPDSVAYDVREGYIAPQEALEVYQAVLGPNCEIDFAATAELRALKKRDSPPD